MTARLIVILGPTATGKTRLGVEIASRLGAEIISADSRQVYRGLDIGSGKDLDEYSRVLPPVPYHLIDVTDPRKIYTLYHFQRDCYQVLRTLAMREDVASGRAPIVMVGGSGLYIEAVLRAYSIADVPEDSQLRSRLRDVARETLIERLQSESPRLAAMTDLNSRKRLIRALEIARAEREKAVGRSEPLGLDLRSRVFGVRIDRREMYRRIERRVDERIDQGMVTEVEQLLRGGVGYERLRMLGLEYRIIAEHLGGATGRQEMVASLKQEIRRFAKRQLTYFRGMERRGTSIRWIEPGQSDVILRSWAEDRSGWVRVGSREPRGDT